MNTAVPTEQVQIAEQLHELGLAEGVRLFLVGGVVRDLLRGAVWHDRDLDVVVEGNAIRFAEKAASKLGGTLKKFPHFYTAKLIGPAGTVSIDELDFASTRTETYSSPGALPTVTLATIAEDLSRRDFSVNAMAIEIARYAAFISGKESREMFGSAVLDMHGGKEDLARGEIRVLHAQSFFDDPTRLFRACRYVARLGGKLEVKTEELFNAALERGALNSLSRFRVATEIRKMAIEDPGIPVFEVASKLGLLRCCSIVPDARLAEFSDFTLRLQQFTPETSPDDRVRALLRAIAALSGEAEREQRLSSFGLSKKSIHEIVAENERIGGTHGVAALAPQEMIIRALIEPDAAAEICRELSKMEGSKR